MISKEEKLVYFRELDEQSKLLCNDFKVGDKVRIKNIFSVPTNIRGKTMIVYRKYKPFLHLRNEDWEEESMKNGRWFCVKIEPNGVEKINN